MSETPTDDWNEPLDDLVPFNIDGLHPSLRADLGEIHANAAADFSSSSGVVSFQAEDTGRIQEEAMRRLRARLAAHPVSTRAELLKAWSEIVADFHHKNHWGIRPTPRTVAQQGAGKDPQRAKLVAYLRTFLVPTMVIKISILYFGLQYAMYPGEGYGYGLVISIAVTLINFAIFIWKNRAVTDD